MSRMKLPTMLFLLLFVVFANGQSYQVELTPITIEGLGGLQSFAVGTFQGEWLLVGGRLDGLHRRQPFASFSADGKNQDLIVVNPVTEQVWRKPLESLPTNVKEQLSSSNMQFYQRDQFLYLTGGYGYSPTASDHITFPYLTVLDVEQVIGDVKNNAIDDSAFTQFENEIFRVTGGALNVIDDTFYLVGGHRFMGRYNPMGPDHGPGFEQEYTNEIRKFNVSITDIVSLDVQESIHDEMHLHRRDYNLTPIMNNGKRELMVFSGVFQNSSDLPWLYPVKIGAENHQPLENFSQYFNHYHCAHAPIYDSENGTTKVLFFGGISQFYMDNNIMVQDNDVPFVNTIAEVSFANDGAIQETKLDAVMPGLLGAGSMFIVDPTVPLHANEIIDDNYIGDEYKNIGYIYGGIRSSLPNIFWLNTGEESTANEILYKVAIRNSNVQTSVSAYDQENEILFYPNPANKYVRMYLFLAQPQDIEVSISDIQGKHVHTHKIQEAETTVGKNYFLMEDIEIGFGAFIYSVKIGNQVISRKVIWNE